MSEQKETRQKSKRIIKLIEWTISYSFWQIVLKDSKGNEIKRSFRFFNDVFDISPDLYDRKNTDIALRAIRRAAWISSEYKRWVQSNSRDLLLKKNWVPIALNNILLKFKKFIATPNRNSCHPAKLAAKQQKLALSENK